MRATPPALLDGARVTLFANLAPGRSPTGATRRSVSNFAGRLWSVIHSRLAMWWY
ncbi:hypothetical protein O7631_07820 [Micromonospora sp. WMMD967]|uniref:hypothetical protein n=1 Tax=Micromonospora sp. WMMD967 TaxID=3016101 RepID=UPI0024159ECE|nr:hypothetical protein [Micromonospora sp. WMMD967]MDG4836422.1 hypothetical protein [Micromonospora sp. WMMD967]